MNPERSAFLGEEVPIRIIPRCTEPVFHLISGDIGPMEAGIPLEVPLWLAIQIRRRNQCTIVPPEWMAVDELKRLLALETGNEGLVDLPPHIFDISHALVKDAKEEITEGDQVKTLIQDLWDKREAKLRSSSLKFLSQHTTAYARMDNVQSAEVCSAASRATLAACKKVSEFVSYAQMED